MAESATIDAGSTPATSIWRDPWACGVGALAMALFALAGAAGPTWLDSGELIAAARELGGIHPPGHPAWLSLAAGAEWLPLGPQAARLSWLSALGAGVSVALCVRIARLVLGPFGNTAVGSMWARMAGLALLASGSLWTVATRVEVYTLALATGLWGFDAALRAGQACARTPSVMPRSAIIALGEVTVAVALGLCNHHYITLFALPALTLAGWPALRALAAHRPRQLLVLVGLAVVVGLTYLALPLRAVAESEMRWGNPATWSGFWDTVSAAHFQRSVTDSDVSPGGNMLVLFGTVVHAQGTWLAAFGALGLALGWLRRDRIWLALLLALLGGLATKAPMAIDTRNPDDHGYLLMAAASLSIGIAMFGSVVFGARGLMAGAAASTKARLSFFVLPWAVVLVVLNCLTLWDTPETNLSGVRGAEVIDSHVRRALPPGAMLLTNYYGLAFNEQAYRLAEGRRPDLLAPHLSMRTGDTDGGRGYQRWFVRRYPNEKVLAKAAAHLGRSPVGNFLEARKRRAVWAEADPDNRVPTEIYEFGGIVHRLVDDRETNLGYEPSRLRQRRTRIWGDLYARLEAAGPMDHQTRSVLAWQHALGAAIGLRRGWREIASDEIKRGRKLAPSDRLLAQLKARLDLLDGAWQRGDTDAFHRLWQSYSRLTLDDLASTPES